MLYDGRRDYIRRREPKRIRLSVAEVAIGLAVLLFTAALVWGLLNFGQPAGRNESFEQLFSMG
jgi:hypothetical protein